MAPKLLVDVIKKQSGTLAKAGLEGGMNAIEAGGTEVHFTLEPEFMQVRDNGRGFRNRKEVEDFFATFGQPHDESEGKIWAQFRMGRGQMFAFGRNVWRTGQFEMTVDIDGDAEKGLTPGFDLKEGLKEHQGCDISIELYNPLSSQEIYYITQELTQYMKYVSIPVFVNGVQVNTPPEDEKWGTDTDSNAYYKLNSGDTRSDGIKIYNLGVFVMEVSRYEHGVGGVIVSKEKVDVNFARNDIIRSCPVWKKMLKVIKTYSDKKVTRKKKMTEDERTSMVLKFNAGENVDKPWQNVPMFKDTSGHPQTADRLSRNYQIKRWTIAPSGSIIADKLMQQKLVWCWSSDNAEQFDFNGKEEDKLPKMIAKACTRSYFSMEYIPWEEAAEMIDSDHRILPMDDLSVAEAVWGRVFQRIAKEYWGTRTRYNAWGDDDDATEVGDIEHRYRRVSIGDSESAAAWTDGVSFVTISRQFIRNKPLMVKGRPNPVGLHEAIELYRHEICHDGDSLTQVHSPEFYRMYHELADSASRIYGSLHNWLSFPKNVEELKRLAKNEIEMAKKRVKRKAEAEKKAHKKKLDEEAKKAEKAVAEPVAAKSSKKPSKKKAKKKATTKDDSLPTAAEFTDKTLIKKLIKRRDEDVSWAKLEAEFGLKSANGMTARRIYMKNKG
jgi:hypothetical protein